MLERPLQLPSPSVAHWDWQLTARCREVDASIFYRDDSDSEATAKSLCNSCLVLDECRAYAVTANEPHGIWGGLNPNERSRRRWEYAPRSRTETIEV
ncbi:WhiB family transcriptional regulator [Rhodococcus sp. TAF43]|uniref:WhiB family transcriptional regulator n=1 Tax=unclassified Rhodococcus (in: high G+C Gram-positive bacteria) TaxID=192944 RepID=UPI0015833E07|nr:WhiB family transcriptional regulator [Rhodococcus sp. W8901]